MAQSPLHGCRRYFCIELFCYHGFSYGTCDCRLADDCLPDAVAFSRKLKDAMACKDRRGGHVLALRRCRLGSGILRILCVALSTQLTSRTKKVTDEIANGYACTGTMAILVCADWRSDCLGGARALRLLPCQCELSDAKQYRRQPPCRIRLAICRDDNTVDRHRINKLLAVLGTLDNL